MTSTNKEPNDFKTLKAAVHIMGILLVVGFIALVIAVIYKVNTKKPKADIAISKPTNCDYKSVDLPMKGRILSTKLDGDKLLITMDDSVVIVDLCAGEVLSRIGN